MNLADVRTIAAKDLRLALRRRGVSIALVAFPLAVAVGLPLVIKFAGSKTGGIPAEVLPGLLTSFQFFFVIGAALLPTVIAAYSIVGEKVERSLEPLLATPAADVDILVGKSLGALLPAVAATWVGAVAFMAISDVQTRKTLGYLYFPNATASVVLLLVIPLTAALSVEACVLVSTRANDVRTAQQIASLVVLPFAALYVASEINAITLDTAAVTGMALVMLALVVGLSFAVRRVFNREEILTRWK